MNIALVDDNQKELDSLFTCIKEQIGGENLIRQFHSGEEFLATWESGAYDLIVLDIFMDKLTGMDVARRIRETDQDVRLVFATSSNEFASESYEVKACFYLRKPFQADHVRVMLERLNMEEMDLSRTLTFPDGQTVLLRNIIYAEYFGHRIVMHNKRGDETVIRIPLSEVEPLLCAYAYFCSPAKGLIVNFYEVTSQEKHIFHMSDGSSVSISRRKAKEVSDAYAAFRFEQLRKGGGD